MYIVVVEVGAGCCGGVEGRHGYFGILPLFLMGKCIWAGWFGLVGTVGSVFPSWNFGLAVFPLSSRSCFPGVGVVDVSL